MPDDLPRITGPRKQGKHAIWMWGKAGTGKSAYARDKYPDAYMKLPNKWWDGYTNQQHVLLDDFDKKHDKLSYHLKIWGDLYGFPAEVKGSTVRIRPKVFIITSNYHPKDIWTEEQDSDPILDRFWIMHFTNDIANAIGDEIVKPFNT